MAIDWTRGYRAQWRAWRVDEGTWADGEPVAGVTGLEVERTLDGDAPPLESGMVSLDLGREGSWAGGYVRFAMLAMQGVETERVDVCTLLFPSVADDGDKVDVDGMSVLYPASCERLRAGTYAPAGVDAAEYAARLLRGSIRAPVEAIVGTELGDAVVFDAGCTVLEAAWSVLSACNLTMRIGGDGSVSVGPMPTRPALVLDAANARLLHPDVQKDPIDWSGVPNRYTAIDGASVAEAANDDPASPTSHAARGWWADVVDTGPVRIGGETLQAYCERRLAEESVAHVVRTYDREWWPDVRPGDLVRASRRTMGVDGDMRVRRQSLSCGRGVVVSEEARMEVASWPIG